MPTDKGNKIVGSMIHRIATDNMVFRRMNSQKNKKSQPEIIILVDLSGSMEGGHLIKPVLSAVKSSFESLYQNNVPTAVYGHTTSGASCVVYAIAANNMPLMQIDRIEKTHDYSERFSKTTGVYTSENTDGVAIQFVASRFSKSFNDKALLVLSDGQPSHGAGGYGHSNGVKHTKATVEELRDSNITVLSLSLVESVVSANDKIYGSEHNVRAYGNQLQRGLMETIHKITKRY